MAEIKTMKKEKQKTSLVTDEIRASAEVYHGDEMGRERKQFFLKEAGLPNGLLPLKNIEECGYVKETGFVWVKQKEKIEYKFEKIGDLTSYGTEVTAYVEPKKIRKLTGVKVREMLVWITLTDIYINDPPNDDKITFKSSVGISKTFPVSAFQIDDDENPDQPGEGKEAATTTTASSTATDTDTANQGNAVEI